MHELSKLNFYKMKQIFWSKPYDKEIEMCDKMCAKMFDFFLHWNDPHIEVKKKKPNDRDTITNNVYDIVNTYATS